jgi:hypothetical protein
MPHLLKTRHTKRDIPDREMELGLNDKEVAKFLEAFPEFTKLDLETYESSQIKVTVTVSAFLKKEKDAV